jgi:hypothetical protein
MEMLRLQIRHRLNQIGRIRSHGRLRYRTVLGRGANGSHTRLLPYGPLLDWRQSIILILHLMGNGQWDHLSVHFVIKLVMFLTFGRGGG